MYTVFVWAGEGRRMELIDKVKIFPDDFEEAKGDFSEIVRRNLDKGADYASMYRHVAEGVSGVGVYHWIKGEELP